MGWVYMMMQRPGTWTWSCCHCPWMNWTGPGRTSYAAWAWRAHWFWECWECTLACHRDLPRWTGEKTAWLPRWRHWEVVRVTDAMISDEKDSMESMLGYTDRRFPLCCVIKWIIPKCNVWNTKHEDTEKNEDEMFQSDDYEMLTHDFLTAINSYHLKGSVHTNDNFYFNILT